MDYHKQQFRAFEKNVTQHELFSDKFNYPPTHSLKNGTRKYFLQELQSRIINNNKDEKKKIPKKILAPPMDYAELLERAAYNVVVQKGDKKRKLPERCLSQKTKLPVRLMTQKEKEILGLCIKPEDNGKELNLKKDSKSLSYKKITENGQSQKTTFLEESLSEKPEAKTEVVLKKKTEPVKEFCELEKKASTGRLVVTLSRITGSAAWRLKNHSALTTLEEENHPLREVFANKEIKAGKKLVEIESNLNVEDFSDIKRRRTESLHSEVQSQGESESYNNEYSLSILNPNIRNEEILQNSNKVRHSCLHKDDLEKIECINSEEIERIKNSSSSDSEDSSSDSSDVDSSSTDESSSSDSSSSSTDCKRIKEINNEKESPSSIIWKRNALYFQYTEVLDVCSSPEQKETKQNKNNNSNSNNNKEKNNVATFENISETFNYKELNLSEDSSSDEETQTLVNPVTVNSKTFANNRNILTKTLSTLQKKYNGTNFDLKSFFNYDYC